MIQLTPAACQEINRLRARQGRPTSFCRLTLQPSSCAQWSYVLSLGHEVDDDDDVYSFEGYGVGAVQLVVKREHQGYIRDLKIDFSEDLTGGAFRFNNPLATESCRCGYAFAIRP